MRESRGLGLGIDQGRGALLSQLVSNSIAAIRQRPRCRNLSRAETSVEAKAAA
jgi:hypothetical protein